MSGQGEILSSETTDTIHISFKNKRKKTPKTLIIRKQTIQEAVNPRKRLKGNNLNDVEKLSPKETPTTFWHEVDYEGDTNEKAYGSDHSPSETDGCVINLAKEHENEEDEEFK